MGKKKSIALIVLNIILLFLAVMQYRDDYYNVSILHKDMQVVPGAEEYVTMPEEGQWHIMFHDTNSFKGICAYSSDRILQRGEYTVTVEYQASEAGTVLQLWDTQSYNPDNTRGCIIQERVLEAGDAEVEIDLVLDQRTNGFSLALREIEGEFELQNINITSRTPFLDAFVFWFIIVFFEILFLFMVGDKQKRMDLFIVLVLAIVTCIPLMNGYQMKDQDDMIVHTGRISAIVEWLQNYSWNQPVMRLDSNAHNGYGYVIPTMYPQLFLLIPALLKCIGVSMLNSIKIFLFLMNLGTAGIAMFSFKRITKNRLVGICSTIIYMFSLYRLIDIYTRAAMGEYLAMVFLPLVLFGLYEIFFGEKKNWFYLTLGITGVVQSHIITTFLVAVLVFSIGIIAVFLMNQKMERILVIIKAGVMTVLLNLWFLVPFAMNYPDMLVGGKNDAFAETTVSLAKIFAVFVESARAQVNENAAKSEMPLAIGLVLTVAIVAGIWSIVSEKEKEWEGNHRYVGYGCLFGGVVSILVSSDLFDWTWIVNNRIGKYFTVMQFAWRFLTLASVFFSLLAGITFYNLLLKEYKNNIIAWLIILAVTCIPSFYYMDSLLYKDTVSKGGMEEWEYHDFLYLPKGGSREILNEKAIIISSDSDVVVSNVKKGYSSYQCEIESRIMSDSQRYLDFPLFYYYGYQAEDENGEILEMQKKSDGTVRVCLEDNTSLVHVQFKEPFLWRVCTMISVIFLVGFVIIMRKREKACE